MIPAAFDGELDTRTQVDFDQHLADCPACAHERAVSAKLLGVLESLPAEADVPVALEQATLRRVRTMAHDDADRPAQWWWGSLWIPAVALAAVAFLAVGLRSSWDAGQSYSFGAPRVAKRPTEKGAGNAPTAVATGSREPPRELPKELAEAPDLFMSLPILRNMDKLQHFEAIQTTNTDDQDDTSG